MKIKRFNQLNENHSDIIEEIKNYLISENGFDYDTWEDFVDNQEMGDCQSIVADIIRNFPQTKKIFGG